MRVEEQEEKHVFGWKETLKSVCVCERERHGNTVSTQVMVIGAEGIASKEGVKVNIECLGCSSLMGKKTP